jgi:hypothetical protein
MKRLTQWVIAALFAAASLTADAEPPRPLQPLRAADVGRVLAAGLGRPHIVAIWSLDCGYCRENTARITAWQKQHRDVRLTLIAMDSLDDNAAALSQALAAWPLPPQTACYVNAEPIPDKLRRALDPGWRGEMPRTLLIDARGAREASSGVLDTAVLDRWRRD